MFDMTQPTSPEIIGLTVGVIILFTAISIFFVKRASANLRKQRGMKPGEKFP